MIMKNHNYKLLIKWNFYIININKMKFENKVAIITGGSRGIWKSIALELAQN